MDIYLCFIFLLGLIFGAYFNICINRIPKSLSILKLDRTCPKCNTKLKVIDSIPIVSYLLSKGKCRHCSENISPRNTFIEILTAIVYCSLYLKFNLSLEFIAFSFLMSILDA